MGYRYFGLVAVFFTFTISPLLAQHMPGAAMGNYSGTQALYHNPAFVADSRYSVHVNFVGLNVYMANNHVRYNAPYSFLSLMTNSVPDKYRNEQGGIILPRSDLVEKLNGRAKHMNLGVEARLPSLMVSLKGGQFGVGVSSRLRTMVNMSQTTEPIARALRSRGKNPDIQKQVYENQSAAFHMNGVGEVALTLGGVLLDNDTEFFKVGATVKRLVGLYNVHVLIDDGSFAINPDPAYNNRREVINLPAITTTYGFTTDQAYQEFRPTPGWLLGGRPAGSGWGFDLGMVYEYRPNVHKYAFRDKGVRKLDGSKNKYLYRLSVALTDVGGVRYKNPAYVGQYQVSAQNKAFRYNRFEGLGSTQEFFNAVSRSLGTATRTPVTSFRSVLPMALQASLDYQLQPNVYLNTLWVQNLVPASALGMKAESVLALTPRYETRWYELSVPVSIMNRYGSFGIGLAGRLGPLWFGTDHLAGLLNIGKPRVFNLYAGISAGLFRRPPKSPNACYPNEKESLWERLFSGRR